MLSQRPRISWLWLLLISRIHVAHPRKPYNPLPLHLQGSRISEITLKAAVLHSNPFAIVEEDEDGELTPRGLQIDMLEKLSEYAEDDGIKLAFELDPWKRSSDHSYSAAFDLVANDCEERMKQLPADSNISRDYDCNSFDIIIGDFFSTAGRLCLDVL